MLPGQFDDIIKGLIGIGIFWLILELWPRGKTNVDKQNEERAKPPRKQCKWIPDGKHLWYRPPYCAHPEIPICNLCAHAETIKGSYGLCGDCRGNHIVRGPIYGTCHKCVHGKPSQHIPNGVDCYHPESINFRICDWGVGEYDGEYERYCPWFKSKPPEIIEQMRRESAAWCIREHELNPPLEKLWKPDNDGNTRHTDS